MPPTALLLTAAGFLLVGLVVRRVRSPIEGIPHRLFSSALPILAAVFTIGLTTWVWGGLTAIPVWHDESAYLLQAELLATGRFAASPPPIGEAFTQAAVLVTPVLAPKMLPGHAALLVPGVWLGLPGLVPVLLTGATAAMIVVLARRVAGGAVALLTMAIWTTQAGQQRWRASYMSESTTALCWLIAWWFLLRWREARRPAWLLALAGTIGLAAVTRPMAALALAIPIGAIVIYDCWRLGIWRQLVGALLLGTTLLAIIPAQNVAVLGDWRTSPLSLYTRQYMPFDRLGYGLDDTPPELTLTPQLDKAMASLRQRHAEHIALALPGVLLDRTRVLTRSVFGNWRVVFVPAAILGLLALPPFGWIAIASAVGLLLLYLPYAHEAHWSVYYVEASPVPALVVAIGLVTILRRLQKSEPGAALGACGLALITIGVAVPEFIWSGRFKRMAQQPFAHFHSLAATLPADRLLVFVRYDEGFDGHKSFVNNVSDASRARIITAHDLGTRVNSQVRAAFPDRKVYRFDTASGRFESMENQE